MRVYFASAVFPDETEVPPDEAAATALWCGHPFATLAEAKEAQEHAAGARLAWREHPADPASSLNSPAFPGAGRLVRAFFAASNAANFLVREYEL